MIHQYQHQERMLLGWVFDFDTTTAVNYNNSSYYNNIIYIKLIKQYQQKLKHLHTSVTTTTISTTRTNNINKTSGKNVIRYNNFKKNTTIASYSNYKNNNNNKTTYLGQDAKTNNYNNNEHLTSA